MTVTKTIDKRKKYTPTFGQLKVCEAFTSTDSDMVYIKTNVLYDIDQRAYNTISLDGGVYWSEDDEEIEPIQEIEITIKK